MVAGHRVMQTASDPFLGWYTSTGETPYHGFLGVPIIQHGRVLGVLVVRQRQVRKFDEEEEAFLVTLAAQLAGAITHAVASGKVTHALHEPEQALVALNGLPGAPGVAIGQAMVVYPPANLEAIPDRPAADIETEVQNFQEAVGAVQDDLRDYANRMSGILPSEELALFDVKVSAVNPGNYKSEIGIKQAAALAEKPYAQPGSPYAEHIARDIEYMSDRSMYKEPDDVTAAVTHALFDKAPKPNYLVVPNEKEARWTISKLIEETAELNAGHEYTYSDEELIRMLREATAAQRR